jgi:hypothetical protein
MGTFSDIANAKTFEQGGNYFIPGDFEVEIKSSNIEVSAKNKKVKHAKVKCKVLTFEPKGDSRPTAFKPGSEVNMVVEVTKEMGASNAKAYAMAAGEQALWLNGAKAEDVKAFLNDFKDKEVGEGEEHPSEKHLKEIFSPRSIVAGVKIRVEAFNKPKADGSPFTRLRWVPTARPDDFDPRA